MKYNIIAFFALWMFLFIACKHGDVKKGEYRYNPETNNIEEKHGDLKVQTVEIDSCEYLLIGNYRMSHKGNCKNSIH